MRRWMMLVLVMAALGVTVSAEAKKEAALAATPPAGADKTYANSDFKFTLQYPADWEAREEKAEMPDMGAAAAMLGRKMAGGLRMATVCFGAKKCEAGSFGKDPQAHLIVADVASMERMAPKGRGEQGARSGKSEPIASDCDMVEKMNVRWAGVSAPWVTMRCPEKKKWRYTTTVTMQRGAAGGKDMYNLMCSMLSNAKEKEESLREYQGDLKPRCQKLVSTTKFGK